MSALRHAIATRLASWVLRALANRDGAYGEFRSGRWGNVVDQLTPEVLTRHFLGQATIGVHAIGADQLARWACWDIDAHDGLEETRQDALSKAKRLYTSLREFGANPLLEDSGRGFHVWVVFDEPLPARSVRACASSFAADGSEVFPKQDEIPDGGFGNFVRLPGRHPGRGTWSRFWDSDRWWVWDDSIELLLDHEPCSASLVPQVPETRGPTDRGARSSLPDRILRGGRNNTLMSLAGTMRHRGMTREAIEAALLAENRSRCEPPLCAAEVRSIAVSVTRYSPADGAAGSYRFPLTDIGNAERFAAQHRDDVRYCHSTGRFHVWTGQRWEPDETGEIARRAVATIRTIYAEAAKAPTVANSITSWAKKSEARPRVDALVALARSQFGIPVRPRDLDADRWLFNLGNGTVDLRSGELRGHQRADLITKLAPVLFDPNAECPLFEGFLETTFSGDNELTEFVMRLLGMCLTGDVTEQILPIFHGEGSNGKSVLLDTVCGLLGDYATGAAPDLLATRNGERHPTELADLFCRRLVVASETEEGAVLRLQLVKRLTGDATIKGRFMRQDFFEFDRTHKIILVTNNKPIVREDTEAAWRRLRLVPFANVVPKHECDKKLLGKLRAEWPGILNKLVAGCIRWQRDGLTEPKAVLLATEQYRAESDEMARFVAECCVRSPTAWVAFGALRPEYERWCHDHGQRPEVGKAFATRLRGLGFWPAKQHGVRGWEGLGLCAD